MDQQVYDIIIENKDGLIAAMKKRYPDATFEIALQLRVKVNTGEMINRSIKQLLTI